jgi:RNA polymerase sigma factor (sigma-70 family)
MAAAASAAPVDERLAVRAPAVVDQQTFISLFETHIEGVYDFALRLLRDRDAAERVVQITFERARDFLPEGGSGRNAIASLYALARRCALDDLRRRRGPRGPVQRDREGLVFTRVDADRLSDPSAVFDKELIELVWDAVAVLSPDEYSLLDLHLRRELTVDELAEHLELNGSADTKLSRLRGVLEDAVRSTLIATRRRALCVQLDTALADVERGPASDVRTIVRRHLDDCEHCRESKHRFVAPADVFHSLAAMPPSPALRKQLLKDHEPNADTRSRVRRPLL